MARQELYERYDGNGNVLESSVILWDRERYLKEIEILEGKVEQRWVRNAPLGDQYAIQKLSDIETLISGLREEMSQLNGE